MKFAEFKPTSLLKSHYRPVSSRDSLEFKIIDRKFEHNKSLLGVQLDQTKGNLSFAKRKCEFGPTAREVKILLFLSS